MRATIEHESRSRMRLRLRQKKMTLRQADLLEAWLKGQPWAREAVVHERTCCVILTYGGDRETVLSAIGSFTWAGAEETVTLPATARGPEPGISRETGGQGADERGFHAVFSYPSAHRPGSLAHDPLPFQRPPMPGTAADQGGVAGRLSIGISAFRRDFGTAGTVMFLLEIGELLEDWTRKKSVADLAESLSLHVDRVWLKTPAGDVLTPIGRLGPATRWWFGLEVSSPWTVWWPRERLPSTRHPLPESPSPWPSGPAVRYTPVPWWRRGSVSWM